MKFNITKIILQRKIYIFYIFCSALISLNAVADNQDDIYFYASEDFISDSNIYRRSNGEVSDRINITTAGINIKKEYSLQKFDLNFYHSRYNYNKESYLSYNTDNYLGNYYLSITPDFVATFSIKKNQVLNDFRYLLAIFDDPNRNRNIRTLETESLKINYDPHKTISYFAGFTRNKSQNSVTFNEQANFSSDTIDIGVSYASSSLNKITASTHRTIANFLDRQLNVDNFLDTGYEERLYDIDMTYHLTGKSLLTSNITYKSRIYDNFTERDYAKLLGFLSYSIQHTDKLSSNLKYDRNVGPFESNKSTFLVMDMLSYQVDFKIAPKTSVKSTIKYSETDFTGRGQFNTLDRQDNEVGVGVGLEWKPNTNTQINLSTSRQKRNSSVNTLDFEYTLTNLNVQFFL